MIDFINFHKMGIYKIKWKVQGIHQKPLFRASDIGVVLEISNIHTSIRDFDNTEKVIHTVYTPGGIQEVTFLTEKGLYQI
jgi:prophage antirepressor-like protein